MWTTLLSWALGFLGQFIIAFITNLRAARADNPKLWETASTIITQIEAAHPDWSGEQKKAYAMGAIREAGGVLLKDVGDSMINTMIELIVQGTKAPAKDPHSGL